ncbi:hypothetical protein MNBD_UNCLBAC01-325 [hydrothermal vent metagenome]|uniref:Uncharacterized protein n=1 Tax=hydrothermal vent metagenome TaxID=652676 RepID=A0A3B1DLD0_9ZZZZ
MINKTTQKIKNPPSLKVTAIKKTHPIKHYFPEEELNLFYLLTEQTVDGIFTINLNGHITYLNKAAKHIIKTPTPNNPVHFLDHIEKTYIKKAQKCFRQVQKGEELLRCELKIIDKKKRILPVECTSSPIYKEGEIIQILTVVRDISKRKQLEHLVTESEKMQALHNFIAGTTHEIQHPLKGLLDHAQKLITTYKERDFEYIGFKEFSNIMHTLEIMRDQIKYCYDTTERLLSLSKKKAKIKNNFCDVNANIRKVIKLLGYQRDVFEIKFEVKLTKNLPRVAINEVEFKQVITNVVTNAIQSIPSDGFVYLKTSYLKLDNKILIECTDNGIGIPKENLIHVFDPFFTTKHRGLEKSSGLGLAIVHSIVKAFGGNIMIKSHLRHGTTVRIVLPTKI